MVKIKQSDKLKINQLINEGRLLDLQRKELDAERLTFIASLKVVYEVKPTAEYNYRHGGFDDPTKPNS